MRRPMGVRNFRLTNKPDLLERLPSVAIESQGASHTERFVELLGGTGGGADSGFQKLASSLNLGVSSREE